jgi:hypothetical protein
MFEVPEAKKKICADAVVVVSVVNGGVVVADLVDI